MQLIGTTLNKNLKPFNLTLSQLRLLRANDIVGYENCRFNKSTVLVDHIIHYYLRRTEEIEIVEQETLETLRHRFNGPDQNAIVRPKNPCKEEIKSLDTLIRVVPPKNPIPDEWECLLCQQRWNTKASCIQHIQMFHNCMNFHQIERCMQICKPK